ncbi:MAG: hypothetical protein ACREBI_02380 [Nitrosotalea sp.]
MTSLDANQLNIATEGLVGIITFYVILDVGSHLSKDTLRESMRRILSITGIFLTISFVLLMIYGQLFGQSTTLSSFVVIWIGSLVVSIIGCWWLYHTMIKHSDLTTYDKIGVVKIANQQAEEILKPVKEGLAGVQKLLGENTVVTKMLAEYFSSVDKSLERLERRIDHTEEIVCNVKTKMDAKDKQFVTIIDRYDFWLTENKDYADKQTKLVQHVESFLDRLGVFLDLLDLESEYEANTNKDTLTLPSKETQTIEPLDVDVQSQPDISRNDQGKSNQTHRLTREDGLRNREMGNQEQLRFSEYLSLRGKDHKCSLLNGTPDFEFHIDGKVKCIGAFKSLTLSVDGTTKQRWIGKDKLLAEIKTAMKNGISVILFVKNIANGRIWAHVISTEGLKEFRGITTPLTLVDSDSSAEKACKDTLEMALHLV